MPLSPEAQLIHRIRAAFQGVTLGQGRGLREAEAMENRLMATLVHTTF